MGGGDDEVSAMRLYHGTKESSIESILEQGLTPRGTFNDGNYAGFLASRSDMVYLSSLCPLQHAVRAKGDGRLVVLEIDIDFLSEGRMLPDEDGLLHETLLRERVPKHLYNFVFASRIGTVNPREQRHRWREILEGGGTTAHEGTVPTDAITRYALIDPIRALTLIAILGDILNGTRPERSLKRGMATYVFEGDPLVMIADLEPDLGYRLAGLLNAERTPSIEVVDRGRRS